MNKTTRMHLLPLLLASLLAVPARAQPPGADFPASTESPAGMLSIRSEDDATPAVSIRQLVYARRGEMDLHMLILRPGATAGQGPGAPAGGPELKAIVYVQGSAWFAQDITTTIPRMQDFVTQSGYLVASVQYRPSTVARAPAQVQDVKSAIRYLRANAERLHIDPDHIGIWGDSSGGHVAAMVGTTDGVADFVTAENADRSSAVQAVVDFFGPTDFTRMSAFPSVLKHDDATSPESTVIGGPIQDPANRDRVQAYNPIHYVSKDETLPPFLIMHGDKDALVPFNQSVLLYEALKNAGQDVTFYKVLGAGHETRFWTPRVMGIVQEFFDRHLK